MGEAGTKGVQGRQGLRGAGEAGRDRSMMSPPGLPLHTLCPYLHKWRSRGNLLALDHTHCH